MGDFQVLRGDGSWAPPPDVRQLRRFVALDELHLPVMPLEYVRDAYRVLGKTDKAAIIDRWLAEHGGAVSAGCCGPTASQSTPTTG